MSFDFSTIYERKGKDAVARDACPIAGAETKEGFSVLPMWIADMNFATCPSIVKAVQERLAHPLFGYFRYREEYYDAIIRWQKERKGVEGLLPEHIGYENGVLGGVASALNAVCSRGDKVLIHAPTYVGFTGCLENNGYRLVHSDLKKDENNVWRMDYADMEEKLKTQHIHAAVLCSPHNPCGRVWERWELEQAMELFKKYDVYVVSDEIWSDIILDGHTHIPTQSISEDAKMRTFAMYAPSKTFNLAGLIGSYHIVYNSWWRDREEKEASLSHYNAMNIFSQHALIGAYTDEGMQWTDELCQVLSQNVTYAYDYMTKHFAGVTMAKPEGTYMLYINCKDWCEKTGKTMDELLKKGVEYGVWWQDGRPFHDPYGIRLNVALPLALVQEAMARLDQYVFNANW